MDGHRIIIICCLVLILVAGCHNDKVVFRFIELGGSDVLVSEKTSVFTNIKHDSIQYFRYDLIDNHSKLEIELNISDRFARLIKNSVDSVNLKFDKTVNYIINNKLYTVYKFYENVDKIDGTVVHFILPDIGLVISRSTTWNNYKELIIMDKKKSKEINILKSLIYNDFEFYHDLQKTIPPCSTEAIKKN